VDLFRKILFSNHSLHVKLQHAFWLTVADFLTASRLVEASFLFCSHIDHGSAIFSLLEMSKLLFLLILTILLLTQDLFCGNPSC